MSETALYGQFTFFLPAADSLQTEHVISCALFGLPKDGIFRLRYVFEECVLDIDRQELHRGGNTVSIAPQVFDLLDYLIRNRERVVTKNDLIDAIWKGRIVSDAAVTTRLNAARSAADRVPVRNSH